jgi:hypothetical protein
VRHLLVRFIPVAALLLTAALRLNATSGATLLGPQHVQYQGAFRVPEGTFGSSAFDYGGTALAFNEARSSLYIVGHDWHQHVAEISVPAVRNSRSLAALDTAAVIQPFADVTDGRLGLIGSDAIKIGGLLPYNKRLYVTAYVYYDASASQKLSHFVSGTNLSVRGDALGPYQVGALPAGMISGYFGVVPESWQPALGGPVLNGNCCLAIVSRTSYGPAVAAFDPTAIGKAGVAHTIPLLYYPAAHPLLEVGDKGDGWSNTSEWFNGTTQIRGVVFPEGTSTVLFFGRQGTGAFCYGTGSECNDPADQYKGVHAYPYRYQIWAYNASELAQVKATKREPWSLRPYAVWQLPLPFDDGNAVIQGATYDRASGRIFVSQARGDGTRPVIHVFVVKVP